MVLDDFSSGIGLVWIIGSSLLISSFVLCGGNNPYPLWDNNTYPLWDTSPMWLSFRLIDWFGLWLGFVLRSGDIFSLWQDREAIFWVERFLDPFPLLMN
jgi:hypothetical protein